MKTKAFYFLFLIVFLSIQSFAARSLSDLSVGLPRSVVEDKLPESRFIETPVYKLRNPTLLWVNVELLQEKGFEISAPPTESQKKQILEALAWVTKDKFLDTAAITSEKRMFYSDYYGGSGIGINFGSARAASAGEVQIKGVGLTPLHKSNTSSKTGRSTIHEAIKDAVWGEVLHRELPFGANRIIAIIDRGGSRDNGDREVLEIREDPVRLGHFVKRSYQPDSQDISRTRESNKKLINAFPKKEDVPLNSSEIDLIIDSLKEYSSRIGAQYGTMHVRKIFHGATSESNILVDGKMIDFGTASSQPEFQNIQFLDFLRPAGSVKGEVIRLLISDFFQKSEMTQEMIQEIDRKLQSIGQNTHSDFMQSSFENGYKKATRQAILKLLGVPQSLIANLTLKNSEIADILFELIQMEFARSSIINLKTATSIDRNKVGTVNELIIAINSQSDFSSASILEILKSFTELSLQKRAEIAAQLSNFYNRLFSNLITRGLSLKNAKRLVSENALISNQPYDLLYMPDLKRSTEATATLFDQGNVDAVAEKLDALVNNSIRSFEGLHWFESISKVQSDGSEKAKLSIFNGRTGTLTLVTAVKGKVIRSETQLKPNAISEPKKQLTVMSCKKAI